MPGWNALDHSRLDILTQPDPAWAPDSTTTRRHSRVTNNMSSDEDEKEDGDRPMDLFQEPSDFYAPEKPATFTEYQCKNGMRIKLRMVGHSPLWGHLLWNAARVISNYLEDNAAALIEQKIVLELGAGAGLPSLVCAALGANQVVVTDYPDAELIENLKYNIAHCGVLSSGSNIIAEGYLWGNSMTSLESHLPPDSPGFDILILADILFNHSEHDKLVTTVKDALRQNLNARALVFFTPYRPWLLDKDMYFFKLAREAGLVVNEVMKHVMDKAMFEDDPGDELLRRTVFGYEVRAPIYESAP